MVVFFKDWAGLTQTQIQTLQSVFSLGVVLLELPTGLIADLVGRKHSLALGSLFAALGFFVYGSFPVFWVFLAGELLIALGISLISGANSALLFDILKREGRADDLQKVRGQVRAVKLVTLALSAQLGSWIAVKWGLNVPLLLMAIPGILATLVVSQIPESKNTNKGKPQLKLALQGLLILKNPQIRRLAFSSIGVYVSAYFLLWLYQPLLQSLKIPLQYNGIFFSFMVVTEALVAANFGRFQHSDKKFMDFSAIVTGLSFLLVGLFPTHFNLLLVLFFAGGFGLTRRDFVEGQIQLMTPPKNHATLLSAISLLARLVLVPLNPVIGLIADHSLSKAFLVVGTIPFLVLFFLPVKHPAKV